MSIGSPIIFCFFLTVILTGCNPQETQEKSTEETQAVSEVQKTQGTVKDISDNELSEAVDENDVSKVKDLLKAGANPNYKDEDGTPIISVIYFSDARNNFMYNEVIKLLLEEGADPNTPINENNDTAISIAVTKENIELVKILLAKEADPTIKNKDNISALTGVDKNTEIGKLLFSSEKIPSESVINLNYEIFNTSVTYYFKYKGFVEESSNEAHLVLRSPTGFLFGLYGADLENTEGIEAAFELINVSTNNLNVSYLQHVFVGISNNDRTFIDEVNKWFIGNLLSYNNDLEINIDDRLIKDDFLIELTIENNIVRMNITPEALN